jgi:hypothetical protein
MTAPNVRTLARIAATAIVLASATFGTISADAIANRHMDKQERQNLKSLMAHQTERFPAPTGCAVVGVWEDGSIAAYCVEDVQWLAHGPDADDTWSLYTGQPMHAWVKLDGQAS